jgi:DNA-binding NtrC family response regulator
MPGDIPNRVLILDDYRPVADVLCAVLSLKGYLTRGTYTHREAMEAAREFQPDIFITGFVNACEKNGCETAAEIVDLLPQCRVLVVSGKFPVARDAAEQYRKRGYEFTVWPKPLHPQDFLSWLKAAV